MPALQSLPQPATRGVYLSLTVVIALLSMHAFYWTIVDVFTELVVLPLMGLAWLMALFTFVSTASHARHNCRQNIWALLPVGIVVAGILASILIPFTPLWLRANFSLKQAEREQVVLQISSGRLTPNVTRNPNLIQLADGTGLSMGNLVVIKGPPRQQFVLFHTYLGVFGTYAGFLWVPNGQTPQDFYTTHQGANVEIVGFGGNWYYIGYDLKSYFH